MKNFEYLCLTGFFLSVAVHVSAQGTSLFLRSGYVDYAGGSAPIVFTMIFNRTPDFMTIDSLGRQADEFQFYIKPTIRKRLGTFFVFAPLIW